MKQIIYLTLLAMLLAGCAYRQQIQSLRNAVIDIKDCPTGRAYLLSDGHCRCLSAEEVDALKTAGILEGGE